MILYELLERAGFRPLARWLYRVELRGTVWSACNAGEAAIAPGQRCAVERVDRLTLHIRG